MNEKKRLKHLALEPVARRTSQLPSRIPRKYFNVLFEQNLTRQKIKVLKHRRLAVSLTTK